MRMVGASEVGDDDLLKKKIEICDLQLEGCRKDYENILDIRGQEAALQSTHARRVAQCSHVVYVLREILDSKDHDRYKRALLHHAREAVSVLRDANAPEWKRLAVASILEALTDSL